MATAIMSMTLMIMFSKTRISYKLMFNLTLWNYLLIVMK